MKNLERSDLKGKANVIEYRSVRYGTLYVDKIEKYGSVLYKSLYWMAKGVCVSLHHVNISVPILYDIGYFRHTLLFT